MRKGPHRAVCDQAQTLKFVKDCWLGTTLLRASVCQFTNIGKAQDQHPRLLLTCCPSSRDWLAQFTLESILHLLRVIVMHSRFRPP